MGIRQKLIDEFRNAFAIPGSDGALTEPQQVLVSRLCREIVRRRLSTPAIAFLEMSQPLNYLGAQAMHFFNPLISSLADSKAPEQFALFLERRDSIEILIREIESQEQSAAATESAPKDKSVTGK